MGKFFMLQGGYDNIDFNPLDDPAQFIKMTPVAAPAVTTFDLTDFLTLQLCNRNDEVLVTGQFNFILSAALSLTLLGGANIDIEFYTDPAHTSLVYQTQFTSANLLGLGVAPLGVGVAQWTVPVQFQHKPNLKVTEDTVNYYIRINSNLTGITIAINTALDLAQYDVSAVEISQSQCGACNACTC